MYKKLFIIGLALLLAFSGCFSPWRGEEDGTLTIALGGTGRFAISLDDAREFSHKITLNGPGGSKSSPWLAPGTLSYSFTGLGNGYYTITVEARHEVPPDYGFPFAAAPPGGYLRAYGEEAVNVTSLDRKPISIRMYPATEVNDSNLFQEVVDNLSTKEFIILTGDIQIVNGATIPVGHEITIITKGAPRYIRPNSTNPGFYRFNVGGTLNLGSDITQSNLIIEDNTITTSSLILVSDGTLRMHQGVTLSNNITSSGGGGVRIDGGTFTMTGGTISEITAGSGGGVFVNNSGTFNMYSGTISGNTADAGDGGGVHVSSGTFNMYGGTILKNKAESDNPNGYGGGVYVSSSGTFVKTGGTIYGSDVQNGNSARVGDAVYVTFTDTNVNPVKIKNLTSGPGVNLNSGTSANWD